MRVTYVSHTRFPIQKAHGMQIAHVCLAMARLGHAVTLVCPSMHNSLTEDAFSFYGIPRLFSVVYLRHFDATLCRYIPGKLHFFFSMFFYRRALRLFLSDHRTDLLYVRSWYLLPLLLSFPFTVFFEVHTLPRHLSSAFVKSCNRCRKVVCLTTAIKEALLRAGVRSDVLLVEADGVDVSRFAGQPSLLVAKERWRLPLERPVVGYAGSLVTQGTLEKGVPELLRALSILRRRGIHVFGFVVGGPAEWMKRYRLLAKEYGIADIIELTGYVRASDIPSVLAACDLLIYPSPASDHPYFHRDTSPLKIFEYMAAKRPIVCVDLLPLHDVVSDESVFFCEPGNPEALAESIVQVLRSPQESARKVSRAGEVVQYHDWCKRMQRILSVL